MKAKTPNQGAVMLAALNLSRAEVAQACGCDVSAVGRWLAFDRLPGEGPRRTIEERWSIPAKNWARPVAAGSAPSKLAQAYPPAVFCPPAYQPPPQASAVSEYKPPDFNNLDASELELVAQCERFRLAIHEAQNPKPGVPPEDGKSIAALERGLRQSLLALAKLRGELNSVEESDLARTATFARHCRRIMALLEPYPDARKAVAVELTGDTAGEHGEALDEERNHNEEPV